MIEKKKEEALKKMKVKVRLIGDKINSEDMLISANNLQLTTKVFSEKLPVTKDVGVMTILEDFSEKDNSFQVVIKNSKDEELGRGNIFRLKIMTEEREAILIYNVNKAYFEKKGDFYTVELWNKDKILDKYDLGCEVEIHNIYNNMLPKGVISL